MLAFLKKKYLANGQLEVSVGRHLVTTADGQHCFCVETTFGRTAVTRSAQPGGAGCADPRACGRM